jgi:DNA-binding transcriptional LysR family regulator
MELRVLRYYLAVCQEKNITKAAEVLHIAQPSLSTQIKGLEQELGVKLFERGHRQIKLTEEGYYLRDRAQEMLAMADQTERVIQGSKLVTGVLRIGAGQAIAIKRIVMVIEKIAQAYPDVSFQLTDGNADDIEAAVTAGVLDFGVVMGDRPLESFESLILPERNEFVANLRQDHPLAQKEKLTPADIVDYPLIVSNQSFVSDKFRNWFGNSYEQVHLLAQNNLAFNAAVLASQGDAVQITYDHLVDKDYLQLVARPLSPKVTDPNVVIWKKNVRRSNLANLFLQELRQSLNED